VAFAANGANVGVLDRALDAARETAALIGANAHAIACDVTDEAAVSHAFDEMERAFGIVDLLVNNAGVGDRRPLLEINAADWRRVIEINLTGAFICAQTAIVRLAHAGKPGSVINIASVAGEVAVPNNIAYVASKHGLVGLTKALALDCAQLGVRVNAIAPGSVETPLTASLLAHPEAHKRIGKTHPLGRWAQPEEIAKLAVFLASEDAAFMTGAVVPIDGGFLAGRPA
jgi:NAD(P)-dependent dehydrogenase (short-subunit alcohol dehydrogenase family)